MEDDPLSPRRVRIRERWIAARDLFSWIRRRGLWWALPLALGLFLFSLVLFLASSSPLAPFFYAIF